MSEEEELQRAEVNKMKEELCKLREMVRSSSSSGGVMDQVATQ